MTQAESNIATAADGIKGMTKGQVFDAMAGVAAELVAAGMSFEEARDVTWEALVAVNKAARQ